MASAYARKLNDPFTFVIAEDFFNQVDDKASGFYRPRSIGYIESDQRTANNSENSACSHGRIFRFDDGKLLLIQFIRPKVWRIRFDFSRGSDTLACYDDVNSRTVMQNTLSSLISVKNILEGINWKVEFLDFSKQNYYILQTVEVGPAADQPSYKRVLMRLFIKCNPFQIIAARPLKQMDELETVPQIDDVIGKFSDDKEKERPESGVYQVIWSTRVRGFLYDSQSTILELEKPGMAKYLGFGEQGGKALFKDRTFMNYFNYDNMLYDGVYGKGALDSREPLYHSEPFWLELNRHPNFASVTANFSDNYSQICIDFGATNTGCVRVATRLGEFHHIALAGDDISEIIRSHTSIVGRPSLIPRYALGYHQGCYGYDSKQKVLQCIDRYREQNYPIDGMHIDIDLQEDYRTFTIDKKRFPDPEGMFRDLRVQGVKCCTNITPFINSDNDPDYKTLQEGLSKGVFVKDERYLAGATIRTAHSERYVYYENGKLNFINPSIDRPDYAKEDRYDFSAVYNSGNNFHGGISYGPELGRPGVYPRLNNPEVRKWWGEQYAYLLDTGLEFVWQDMTGPCMAKEYGDMKSFPFRLLMESDGRCGELERSKKPFAEIWSLYSYNLHKATFKGLNRLQPKKRNFIIGRGSFAGMHRFAALWTGDNGSTWDFLKISVTQVLALGLSGTVISGADVGGFQGPPPARKSDGPMLYAPPKLLMRWYGAYFMLPWFRNHYNGKPGNKKFQEPYAYIRHYEQHKEEIDKAGPDQKELFEAVDPVCRYLVQLRYSLLQLLYDTIFDNQFTGLPVARALIVTDFQDTSLYVQNRKYVEDQYIVGQDLLISPILNEKEKRIAYLPRPNNWFKFNLQIDKDRRECGVKLSKSLTGGAFVVCHAPIKKDISQLPHTTPMFVREGAIIPQIQVRNSVPDRTFCVLEGEPEPPNPITINVYPGRHGVTRDYYMYLDDGVSRDSIPDFNKIVLEKSRSAPEQDSSYRNFGLPGANSVYRKVQFTQTINFQPAESSEVRLLTIRTLYDHYGENMVKRDIGEKYTIVFWQEETALPSPIPDVVIDGADSEHTSQEWDADLQAMIVKVPVEAKDDKKGISIAMTTTLGIPGPEDTRMHMAVGFISPQAYEMVEDRVQVKDDLIEDI